jgi:hypothetical protein
MNVEPRRRDELISIWPQERISLDCFATLTMDLTAPFFMDMGLCSSAAHDLRFTIRSAIGWELGVFGAQSRTSEQVTDWLERFAFEFRHNASEFVREKFWVWVRDIYTHVPADRPNWEMYEMFFFRWSVEMRDGQDTAGCFRDGRSVYEAYHAFTRARRLDERITERRSCRISAWDQSMILRMHGPAEVDVDTSFDPFGVVEATADRNYFQQFWEYLLPQLSEQEKDALFTSLRWRCREDFRLPLLVPPSSLSRSVR